MIWLVLYGVLLALIPVTTVVTAVVTTRRRRKLRDSMVSLDQKMETYADSHSKLMQALSDWMTPCPAARRDDGSPCMLEAGHDGEHKAS